MIQSPSRRLNQRISPSATADFFNKIGPNPTWSDGCKNLLESEPTTLPAMAYEIARGVLEQYPIMRRIELHLIHFSRGLESKDEAEDNHVVNLVLQR